MAKSKSRAKVKTKVKVKAKPNRTAHNTIIEKAVVVRTEMKKK